MLADATDGNPRVVLIGTGSEVAICLEARKVLQDDGMGTRVVSMPSWELFEEQEAAYREQVLPPETTARVAVEAGVRQGWDRYLGDHGQFVGIDRFGASAPYQEVYQTLGLTVHAVVEAAKRAEG